MLTPEGRVKILDFGLARFASEAASEAGITGTGTVLGTVDYIAPEQADNAHQADIRADVYSLGCTLYHLLAGLAPLPDEPHQTRKQRPFDERFLVGLPRLLIEVFGRIHLGNMTRKARDIVEGRTPRRRFALTHFSSTHTPSGVFTA
jgi:serine/threonine protein kinase